MVNKYRHAIFAIWAVVVIQYVRMKVPVLWQADWSHDDLMNTHRILHTSWIQIGHDILFFWQPTPLFRPIGELFYKVLWESIGFSAFGWHFVCGALLIGNAFLLGHVASRLSGSFSVGLAATAIASFHSLWAHLYLNTGTVFEILAFSFVYLGLAAHIEFHNPYLTTALLILGLNSKESAIVLVVFVVLYEWLWHKRTPWLFCGLAGSVCLAFILGRVYGPGGLTSIGQYKPSYTLSTYLNNFRGYFGPLVLWKAIPLWAAIALTLSPLLLRNRLAYFAVLIFAVGILPLAFVPDRGLEGVYIACAALPLALSSTLLLMPKESWRLAGAVALFVAVGLWMLPLEHMDGWDREFHEIRSFREQLKTLEPNPPQNSQMHFLSEPFTEDMNWASTFITGLVYPDTSIHVIGAHTPPSPASKIDTHVFEWRDQKLYRIK